MSKFFSKLKGDKEDYSHLTSSTSSSTTFSSNNPYRHTQSQPPAYQPPPGPPPSHHLEKPSTSTEDNNPPPYHDWTSIPDTSLLPPPPALASDYSPSTNASYDEAAAAHAWCAAHPVFTPKVPNPSIVENVMTGQNSLTYPPGASQWKIVPVPTEKQRSNNPGAVPTTVYQILSPSHPAASSTSPTSQPSSKATSTLSRFLKPKHATSTNTHSQRPHDQCWTSTLPLYFAALSNPLSTPSPKPTTITFTITPLKYYTEESTLSIGLLSLPYPPARQPGWHRASLAIHSDDGNKYVNDSWGGVPFTTPFREGETITLSLVISPERPGNAPNKASTQSDREVRSPLPRCKTRVYLTRDGEPAGTWDVDEERDAERDEGVAGLSGESDLYAAVGTYGDVDVEVGFYARG